MDNKDLQEVIDSIMQAMLLMEARINKNFEELRNDVSELKNNVKEMGFDIKQIRLNQEKQDFEIDKIKRIM